MAARFFVDGLVTNDWSDTLNWSASSGGVGGASVPGSADDVTFDASSPDCTIDTAPQAALSLTCTDYAGTLTFSQTLTVTNDITLGAAMAFAGASGLISIDTCTFTSNGTAVGVPLSFTTTNVTVTLADDLTCAALLTINPIASGTRTFTGQALNIGAGWSYGGGTTTGRTIDGTTVMTFTGTGTWQALAASCQIQNSVTFAAGAGTITVTGTIIWSTGTLTYTSGTMVVTGSTLIVGNGAAAGGTLACNRMTWETVQFNGHTTTTLNEDLNVSTALTINPDNANTRTINGSAINTAGSFTIAGVSSTGKTAAGTTVITLTGTGTWQQTVPSTQCRIPIHINTAGTITVSGTVRFNTGTLSYTAGTLAQSSTGTIHVDGGTATVFDFNGGSLGPVTLLINDAGVRLNLASELVIPSTGGFTFEGTNASNVTIRSDSGGTQRKFTVQAGAAMRVRFTSPTDIDSGDGVTVRTNKGTITNTINWTTLGNSAGNGGGGKVGGGGVTVQNTFRAESLILGNPGVSTY